MNITLRLFSPPPLRDHVAGVLRMLAAWLTHAANRLSPQKRPHRGEAPMFGGPALTLPTELEIAFGSIKAAILQKLLEWIQFNERRGQTNYQGHYWTHISYNTLHKNHFPKRHPDTLRKYIRAMEKAGLIISCQPDPTDDKWYRLDMKAISKAVQLAGNSPRGAGERSRGKGQKPTPLGDSPTQRTTENLQIENLQIKNPNTEQQQQLLQDAEETDVVVVDLPHPEPEPISGEHPVDGEGHDATAVKAFVPHEQHHNDQPISKVPLKVLSPLAADLVKFGVLTPTAQRLVDQYAEVDIRRILDYARAARNLINPPGFVVDELDTGKSGVLAAPPPVSQSLSAAISGDGPPVEIEAWRVEALRRENERWAAEEAAEMHPPPAPEYA